jgi:uncharacterized protein
VTSRPSRAESPCRLVLDTNVWLDLLVFEDPRCAALAAALHSGRALALIDAACRAEWQRVLAYPALRLSAEARQALVRQLDALAVLSEEAHPEDVRPEDARPVLRCRDRDDQKFLALALRAHAQTLLSRDQALLELAARSRRLGLFGICQPDQWQPGPA